jgi:hypothetical protein
VIVRLLLFNKMTPLYVKWSSAEGKQDINILLALFPFTYIIAVQCLKYSITVHFQSAFSSF